MFNELRDFEKELPLNKADVEIMKKELQRKKAIRMKFKVAKAKP